MESNKTFRIIMIVTLVTILTPVESKYVRLRDSFVARALLRVLPLSNPPSESESPSPAPAPMEIDIDSSAETPASAMDSPSPCPEAPVYSTSPANPPAEMDIDSPAPSPDSISPTNSPSASPEAPTPVNLSDYPVEEIDMDSPSPSPETPADSASPANPPAEMDVDSPAPSPDSISPTNSPSASPEAPAAADSPAEEIDIDSPAPSPDSISPTNSPSASPEAPAAADSPAEEIDIDSPAPTPEAPADSISPVAASTTGKTLMSSSNNLLKQPLLSPEIKTICGQTDHPPLCESSVSPLLTPEFKPDAYSVLILAIQASINATKAVIPTVYKVAEIDCQELYDNAVLDLEDAVNTVKSRDIFTANIQLSAAMTDYETCNDGFEEAGESNPLADVADNLKKMVSNCLAISTSIK